MVTNNPEKLLLDEFDLAGMLDVPVATIRQWRKTDQGPRFLKIDDPRLSGRKIDCLYRYRLEDINAWIAERPTGGEQPKEARS
jgi:hypothetical protein